MSNKDHEWVLALDPGLCTGWALFHNRVLTNCGALYEGDWGHVGSTLSKLATNQLFVVIERPVIYPHGRQQARPRDIITLALRAGELRGRFGACESRYVEPNEWKGNVPKAVCHTRVKEALTPAEARVANKMLTDVPPAQAHNVLDAVGIGLWHAGRIKR